MRNISTMAGLAALLAACSPQKTDQAPAAPAPAPAAAPVQSAAPPVLSGFSHVKGEDLFGYYMPTQEVKIGAYTLQNLSILPEEDFVKWEAGERTATSSPIMLDFADESSQQGETELGQPNYTRTIRVLARAYKVGGGDFRFVGVDPVLGDIQIDGTFNLDKLKANQAQGPNGSDDPVLMTGARFGAQVFKTLSFSWFGGD